jgi:diguanylate cyclase (GGDEF)-like protein
MRILVAEDDNVSRRILEVQLGKWGHEVTLASDGPEAWAVLDADAPPRLAILDWMMPGMDGIEVLRRLRATKGRPYTYVIMLTARHQTDDIVGALDAGADDYIVKPFEIGELRARIRVGHRTIELQTALERANEKLAFSAEHDGLTSLLNRTAVLERLSTELSRSARLQSSLAILLVDIDHFKRVNDTYGHVAGDQVLVEVAARLRSVCRDYDMVARYGGEEFMVIAPSIPYDGMLNMAERLRAAVERDPVAADGNEVAITASIGAILVAQAPGAVPDLLVKEADALLYRAKDAGRNRAVCGVLHAEQPAG